MGRPRTLRQRELALRGWGGWRPGAGRKPKDGRPLVRRCKRAALAGRFPVHVTVRVRPGLPGLRSEPVREVLVGAFAQGCERFGFRLVHYSIQRDHLHLIVEAKDRRALSRGMQGLLIRVAKALNRLWGRKGTVFADRYDARVLRTPREVRQALVHVLNHPKEDGSRVAKGLDPFSSGCWFDGWRERPRLPEVPAGPVAAARTWLLRVGWRRLGRLRLDERPAGPRAVCSGS